MKKITRPSKIELTEDEKKLLSQINFDPKYHSADFSEILRSSCESAATLSESILSHKAIPEIRLRYFTDPELNIGTKMSRKEVFEHNGTKGRAILEHGHFLEYLQYFIFGPQLPDSVIDGFVELANDWYTECEGLRKYARKAVRENQLDPHNACEEFYKLALECDLQEYEARSIRDAVKSVR